MRWGVFAPVATFQPILVKLHAELVKVLSQANVRMQLAEQVGMGLVVSSFSRIAGRRSLAAPSAFTGRMRKSRRMPTQSDLKAFFDVGHEERHILGVILAVAVKTRSIRLVSPLRRSEWMYGTGPS